MPIEVGYLGDRTALDLPTPAFGVLKRGFHSHPPAVNLDQLAASWQIRDHNPDFFVARFPAHWKFGRKAMLLPDQGGAVPLLTFSCDELSPTLPIGPASLVLPTH